MDNPENSIVKAESGVVRVDDRPKPLPTVQYPWSTMEIGDSFLVSALIASTIYNLLSAANKILYPKRFTSGKDNVGRTRVWRTN